ncbi:hypothetical protein ATANTOWER_006333 [Ataeniobius toweri]|uniref:Uncharacterized protein n=1 Tax=Ataeniobius toweri TaxID=208326 RepID=A0ABU7A0Y5_9TELE|nr:hypothetical protein [Ataeniobius toweri]
MHSHGSTSATCLKTHPPAGLSLLHDRLSSGNTPYSSKSKMLNIPDLSHPICQDASAPLPQNMESNPIALQRTSVQNKSIADRKCILAPVYSPGQKILQRRNQFGEYHRLLQELCLDDSRSQRAGTVSPLQNTCPSVFAELIPPPPHLHHLPPHIFWLPRSLAANPPPVSDQGEDISKSKPYKCSS